MQKPVSENDLRAITFYADRAMLTVSAVESEVLTRNEGATLLRADLQAIQKIAGNKTVEQPRTGAVRVEGASG